MQAIWDDLLAFLAVEREQFHKRSEAGMSHRVSHTIREPNTFGCGC